MGTIISLVVAAFLFGFAMAAVREDAVDASRLINRIRLIEEIKDIVLDLAENAPKMSEEYRSMKACDIIERLEKICKLEEMIK